MSRWDTGQVGLDVYYMKKTTSCLDLAVVSARDDPLGVEPDAPDELLVTLQDPQAGAALDVPQLQQKPELLSNLFGGKT